jgi:fluoride exporter
VTSIVLVFFGGGLGSVARFLMVTVIDGRWPIGFPLATLLVNVSGSFAIGLIAGLTDHKGWQQFLMVGIMGGFTTFSSFSLQTLRLAQDERWGAASLYIALSVACCLLGTWAGLTLAKSLSPLPAA